MMGSLQLHLIEELGPHLGLHINFSKCELFSRNGNSLFLPVAKSSLLSPTPGHSVGSYWEFCALLSLHCRDVCNAQGPAIKALRQLTLIHVAFSLLCMCGSHCKLIRVARVTPLSLCTDYLKLFDEGVRLCFTSCIAVDVPESSWQQAQLSPSFGGIRFHSLALH